jgi:hypothetical protein
MACRSSGGQRRGRHVHCPACASADRDPAARCCGVLGSVPAAMVRRRQVRQVRRRPRAGVVPWIVWHMAQLRLRNSAAALRLRRSVGSAGAGWRCARPRPRTRPADRRARRRPSSRAGSRRTRRTGRGTGRAGRRAGASCAVRPGIRSFLPCRLGTQRLWITSSDFSVTTTGRPTGTCISLAVSNMRDVAVAVARFTPPPLVRGDLDVDRVLQRQAAPARGR